MNIEASWPRGFGVAGANGGQCLLDDLLPLARAHWIALLGVHANHDMPQYVSEADELSGEHFFKGLAEEADDLEMPSMWRVEGASLNSRTP